MKSKWHFKINYLVFFWRGKVNSPLHWIYTRIFKPNLIKQASLNTFNRVKCWGWITRYHLWLCHRRPRWQNACDHCKKKCTQIEIRKETFFLKYLQLKLTEMQHITHRIGTWRTTSSVMHPWRWAFVTKRSINEYAGGKSIQISGKSSKTRTNP